MIGICGGLGRESEPRRLSLGGNRNIYSLPSFRSQLTTLQGIISLPFFFKFYSTKKNKKQLESLASLAWTLGPRSTTDIIAFEQMFEIV